MPKYNPPKVLGLTQSGKAPASERGSQEIIASLKRQGLSYSEIGRRLDRDSSLISQIARGKKPGVNLRSALEKIERGEREAEKPERRRAKSGELARVRKGTKPKGTKPKRPRLLRDKEGRIKFGPMSENERTFVQRLRQIATSGGKVSVRLRFEDGTEKVLYSRGGEYAQKIIREVLIHPDGAFAWLSEEAASVQGYSSADYGEVVGAEIMAVY